MRDFKGLNGHSRKHLDPSLEKDIIFCLKRYMNAGSSDSLEQSIGQVCKEVREACRQTFPASSYEVDIVGSVRAGLSIPTSDLDLTILFNSPFVFESHEHVVALAKHMWHAKFKVKPLTRTRTPLIYYRHSSGVHGEISFNNSHGSRKALILSIINRTDPRAKQFIHLIKLVAHALGVFKDPGAGLGLRSFGWMLLAVFYLTALKTPVLPPTCMFNFVGLQGLPSADSCLSTIQRCRQDPGIQDAEAEQARQDRQEGWNIGSIGEAPRGDPVWVPGKYGWPLNEESLASLLHGFCLFVEECDFATISIDAKTGSLYHRDLTRITGCIQNFRGMEILDILTNVSQTEITSKGDDALIKSAFHVLRKDLEEGTFPSSQVEAYLDSIAEPGEDAEEWIWMPPEVYGAKLAEGYLSSEIDDELPVM